MPQHSTNIKGNSKLWDTLLECLAILTEAGKCALLSEKVFCCLQVMKVCHKNLKHTQQTKVVRDMIQEEANAELFNMLVEISNSKVINRPNAEDQLLVEAYGCTNHNACVFRKHQ